MRIFGWEINRSVPNKEVDGAVWLPHGTNISRRLQDLTPDELRAELAIVLNLAKTQQFYYIRQGDDRQRLHVRNWQDAAYLLKEVTEHRRDAYWQCLGTTTGRVPSGNTALLAEG